MLFGFSQRYLFIALILATSSCATTPVSKTNTLVEPSNKVDKKDAAQAEQDLQQDAAAPIAEDLGDGFCQDDIYASYLRSTFLNKSHKSAHSNRAQKNRDAEATFAARNVLVGRTSDYFGAIPVVANDHVERWIRHFQGEGRQTFIKWLVRSQSYRELVVPLLVQEGLPPEFFFMAMIESGFSNTAASSKRATGTWQFMKGTAQLYDLKIDHWVDERRDPVKSTVAAARYLRDLYGIFGDWYLAMAAYNAGPGKIKRAMRKAGTRDFWDLVRTSYLRPETKNYVPKMLAALNLSLNAKHHGFDVGTDEQHAIPLTNVRLDRPISLEEVANELHIPEAQLRSWNPELVRNITPPRKSQIYELRIAQALVEPFEQLRDRLSYIEVTDILMHKVRAGDTLSAIAKRYRVTIAKLREINPNINVKTLKIGGEIAVPIPGVISKSAPPTYKEMG